jgi:predicted DNA-binding transcriptional regulator AlpA
MTPAPRRKPAVCDSGPIRLADATDHQPEDPRPEARPQGGSPRGRTLPASIEPMLHIDDLAELLSCSRRLVERMRSAGKIPKPDIHVGRCPRWKPATIRAWIERGGKP